MIGDFFPFAVPRESQRKVMGVMDEAFKKYKRVILESPVGSGKSAMALAFARSRSSSFILTPQKSLQDQYFHDFSRWISLLKGRSSYPCIDARNPRVSRINLGTLEKGIAQGSVPSHLLSGVTCADGRCTLLNNAEAALRYRQACTARSGVKCPYSMAIEVASRSPHVVTNLHAFAAHIESDKFQPRPALAIDEVHDMVKIVRDLQAIEILVRGRQVIPPPGAETWRAIQWTAFLLLPENFPQTLVRSSEWVDYMEFYKTAVTTLSSTLGRDFVFEVKYIPSGTVIKFRPVHVQRACQELIIDRGEETLMMSSTIYSKMMFCEETGLDPDTTGFIRVNSTFPLENRPILFDSAHATNSSAPTWDRNFGSLMDNIHKVMARHVGTRGLIHTSSYDRAAQISEALGPIALTHQSDNLARKLDEFYRTPNAVFVSPSCHQGVDFKGDRARYQILTTVPYPYVGDTVTQRLMRDPRWYDMRTLVTFGQQIGRIVRSEEDFGATYLLDSRFRGFLKRNRGLLPEWLWAAVKGI